MKIDITKPIYARDKEDGKVYLVDGLYFPLGKISGKDITIYNEDDDLSEWRSIEDVELMQDEYE